MGSPVLIYGIDGISISAAEFDRRKVIECCWQKLRYHRFADLEIDAHEMFFLIIKFNLIIKIVFKVCACDLGNFNVNIF